jgi:DNA-binding response OmpR family regulator
MTRQILIAEDEEPTRRVLTRILGANQNYEITLAIDGIQGVQKAIQNPPDLIITDVSMPNLDGLRMVSAIRHLLGRKVPVIVLTAKDGALDVVAGIQAGARHYLFKPIDMVDLEDKVMHILGC